MNNQSHGLKHEMENIATQKLNYGIFWLRSTIVQRHVLAETNDHLCRSTRPTTHATIDMNHSVSDFVFGGNTKVIPGETLPWLKYTTGKYPVTRTKS